jgi:hypothetical protein
MRWIVVVTLILFSSFASAQAAPQNASASQGKSESDLKEQAAARFDRATTALHDGDFGAAGEDFERAHRLVPSAMAAEYAIRSYVKAARLYRAALLAKEIRGSLAEGMLRTLCDTILEEAERTLARVSVECVRPCAWILDAQALDPNSPMATRWEIYVPPGQHSVSVHFENGETASTPLSVSPGERRELSFVQDASAPEQSEPPTASTASSMTAPVATQRTGLPVVYFWSATVLTAAGVVLTTASGLDTLYRPGPDRVREECAQGDVNCPLYREGLEKQRRTNILLATTLVLGASTTVLGAFFTDFGGNADRPTATKRGSARRTTSAWHLGATLPNSSGVHVALRGTF